MSEHEHEWTLEWEVFMDAPTIYYFKCHECGEKIGIFEIEPILNNPTVKTIINVVIARRESNDD